MKKKRRKRKKRMKIGLKISASMGKMWKLQANRGYVRG